MRRHAIVLTVLLLCGGLPAAAVDLDSLRPEERRFHCFAYIELEAAYRQWEGEITAQQFEQTLTRLAIWFQNRGDNYNYAPDYRRLHRTRDAILAEDPTVGEVLSNAAACRQGMGF
jgi:hypothetical protein